ncbi:MULTISPECIES: chromate efflux transporter [Corallococcus]|uniref:chromate efflux transporter n=1 Tax=Corallococcus TaxID=83461 RepID=UPI00117FC112|nr:MULTISPECIES: chromate efflux transporter [Corallococcus]NBD08973.1 chromate efflux transporter [Corallococcus silvisoli]TSC32911.1 chromate efflux transporter [Corallococcus sp. Z5C101001]
MSETSTPTQPQENEGAASGRRETAPVGSHPPTASRLLEVAAAFLRLGCLSFGGPIAHLGYLRAEFVGRRRWLDDAHYGDLVALCQFLPGPASSQVVFALGMQRAGLLGALLASACFTLPSALLMIGFAYGVARASDLGNAGWLHGLKLAAVAVIAQAVWGMGRRLCIDRARISLCIGSAAVLLAFPGALAQFGVIAGGGLVGWWLYRSTVSVGAPPGVVSGTRGHIAAAGALVAFLALQVALPLLASATESHDLAVFDSLYRAGSLVFGGGHVVLPLLRAEIVPRGWLTDDQFLAGYGAAQALPGPLFAFAAYLGAAMKPGAGSWLNGLWCLLAIFLPAWLLIGGALPFWHRLREKRWARAALAGANAAVVGVLLAALYTPVMTESVRGPRDVVAALLAFGLLEQWAAPPWLVVAASAAAGQWLLGA